MNIAKGTLRMYKKERLSKLRAIKAARLEGLDTTALEQEAAELLESVARQKLRVYNLEVEAGEWPTEKEFRDARPSPSAEWRIGRTLGPRYEISEDGFVRHALRKHVVARRIHRRRAIVHVLDREGKSTTFMLDKLVAEVWCGIPAGPREIKHKDKNGLNCRKENLE